VAALRFPLHLASVEQGNSVSSPGLQLADIMAGGVATASKAAFRLVEPNSYNSAVLRLYSESNFMYKGIARKWPDAAPSHRTGPPDRPREQRGFRLSQRARLSWASGL
jgi:hypothetical protein